MDKDLLRIVIISVGALVILGMILWGIFTSRSRERRINFYDKKPLENIDPSLVVHTEDDEFDIVPVNARGNENFQVTTRVNPDYVGEVEEDKQDEKPLDLDQLLDQDALETLDLELSIDNDLQLDEDLALTLAQDVNIKQVPETQGGKKQLPALLQFSIVARGSKGFAGLEVKKACEHVGLIFGSVKVFERLDKLGRVDYAVASMLEPGTFPENAWQAYECPGITFFMQPEKVDNANQVFNEMVNTIGQLSAQLKGDVFDQKQQLLTEGLLQDIESSLSLS